EQERGEQRERLEGEDVAERRGLARERRQAPPERDDEGGVADEGDRLAAPEEPEVAAREGGERTPFRLDRDVQATPACPARRARSRRRRRPPAPGRAARASTRCG